MDRVINVLRTAERFSIGTRFLCLQKFIELEERAKLLRSICSKSAMEATFHYSEKLHLLTLITNYLLDPETQISELEFLALISKLESSW